MEDSLYQEELDKLLSETIVSARKRERSVFDEMAAPFEKSLVLFGAGGLGKKTLAGLRRIGIEPLAFTDNNPALWGKKIQGVKVLSLKEAAEKYGQKAAFVITIWGAGSTDTMSERRQKLQNLECNMAIPFSYLYWKYSDVFLPYYTIDLPHKMFAHNEVIKKAFHLMADKASQLQYIAQLKWRILGDFAALSVPVKHKAYFPSDLFSITSDEVFIDCGAFDGDTTRMFLQKQSSFNGHIVAFEPDPLNFQKFEQYASSLPSNLKEKLTIYPYAIGSKRSRVRFEVTGSAASSVSNGNLEVDSVTLDETLVNLLPTYIKMDIEGAEIDALSGGQKIISTNLPTLAISSYHRQDHLWRIPNRIHSFSDQYRFYLRPHDFDGWDLVSYAISESRLKKQ